MKSFSQIIQEASAPKARVVLFGRMNPPTQGHEENVLNAHKVAEKHAAELHIIASHSHDDKKNPLSPAQKTRHLKRAFGHLKNTSLSSSSAESPSILSQAVSAHKAGVGHFIMAGGGDRAADYHKLLKQYNGVKGKPHGFYKFDKITVANTGARKEGISGSALRKHATQGNYAKFKQHLPSKIQSNDKHAQELYQHVQKGLTQREEFTREDYVQGLGLNLNTWVQDSHTGLSGKIVYRGPTYVTVEIDENFSLKRWIHDVDVDDLPVLPSIPTRTFKTFVSESYPADVKKQLINHLHMCGDAQAEFGRLLDDDSKDQGVVLQALTATAQYLTIEEKGMQDPARLNDTAVTLFVDHMTQAATLLRALGDLPAHEEYMEYHAQEIIKLLHSRDSGPKQENVDMDRFKHFVTEKTDHDKDPDADLHLDEKDIVNIEKNIDNLQWNDVKYLYANDDQELAEESDLQEVELSAVQRMKKKMEFIKSKAKREIARKIALKRMSTQGKLKRKAIVHARKMIMQRILRGRDKAKLSAAEKSRIETLVSKQKQAVIRISNRMLPQLRSLEQKRLKHMNEASLMSTDTDVNDTVKKVKQNLAGDQTATIKLDTPNAALHLKKMKHINMD